ncbi:ribosomal L1 domain-containing protein CG13096 [Drosophila busckii]|uniref:ribosomal L1 domain-containing protein CG13096 n=1 Tax=Drosophila busckii TaxID=30019 RepID=UPI00083E9C08|nr:ribosomal L1 domain-containing protein CG13096 [Drosophila busckii]
MYAKNKSKVLQTLEETLPPLSHDDAIDMITKIIRKPDSNPIEAGLRLGNVDKHSKDSCTVKLQAALGEVNVSSEALNKVMPVSNEQLTELAQLSTALQQDDEDEDEDDDVEYDEDDDEDDDDADDDDDDDDDAADSVAHDIGFNLMI